MFYKALFLSILYLVFSQDSLVFAQDKKINNNVPEQENNLNKLLKIEDGKNNNSQPQSNKKFASQPLMLSPKESKNLEKALSSLVNNVEYIGESLELNSDKNDLVQKQEEEKNEKSYIYLASLLYFNPNSWVVWINDKKITSDENDPEKEFYIKHINRNYIDLVWTLGVTKWKIITGKNDNQLPEKNDKNQIVNSFKLRPNQTYVLADDSVVEGKVTIKKTEGNNNSNEDSNDVNANEFDFF